MFRDTLHFQTNKRTTIEITNNIQKIVDLAKIHDGMCNEFLKHTSASLILCENADPSVRYDLETYLSSLVQDGDPLFTHTAEGPDDMSAHIRSILTQNSISIPISSGRLDMGTWQGLYLWEHRTSRHQRKATITIWE